MAQWINDQLGARAETEATDRGAIVINVSDLRDASNNTDVIAQKLLVGLDLLTNFTHARVLVECKGGISRSPTIAAGILAMHKNVDLDICLSEVAQKIRRTQYNYDLVDSLKKTLKSMPKYRHLVNLP
jgi:predicted protein tyrosine phosphatase